MGRRHRMNLFLQVAFLIIGLWSGPVANQAGLGPNRLTTSSDKAKETKALFKQHCIKCHGKDGRGQTAEGEIAGAQDFTDSEWQSRVDEQRLINSITYGRGQMPAFEKKLNRDQIKSLSEFVLTLKN